MTLRIRTAIALAFALPAASALATDVTGDVWGTWTLAGSPYYLIGDVRVPPGQTLTIQPGVVVIGQGNYKLLVDHGNLQAVGTVNQPILMTAADQGTGWRGIILDGADNSSIICRCIIEYAKGTGAYPAVRGGAIHCKNCSPTICHNELRYNYSHNANYNGTGGGVLTDTSSALIAYNYIHDNIADSGAGVCTTEYGSPRVVGNLIVGNTAYYAGGGMYFGARSSPIVENNVILHNSSGGWGGGGINSWTSYIYYNTFAIVRNNLIAHNSAPSGGAACGGGGVYCRYDRCILTGNTIADNQAYRGGGIYALNYPAQAPIVTDCIIWGNTATLGSQIYPDPDTGSHIVVNYSDVQGGWTGTGNLDVDPEFADPAADDYHLQAYSKCIDRGDPNFVPQPGELDIDGQMRVWGGADLGGRVDMGADEYGSFAYGDLNCDGTVDGFDIQPFVLALTNPAGYGKAYPQCRAKLADVNFDGQVDGFDIQPFVRLLTGG